MSLSRPRGIPRGARGMISELLRLAAAAGGRLERPRRTRHVTRRRRRVGRPRDQARGHHRRVEQVSRKLERIRHGPAAMAGCRGVLAAQAVEPRACVLARGRRHHSGWPSPPATRFPQGACVRSTAPSACDFAPISSHEERQLRLALAAQDVELDVHPGARGEPPADSRQSPTATMHWQQGCWAHEIFKQRLVDAGRIASSERPLGGRGLCQSAKIYVVVQRCRALAAGTRPAGPRFAERC
jgi:hypothetical protein